MMPYSVECSSSSVTALLSTGTLAPACPSHAARPCSLGGGDGISRPRSPCWPAWPLRLSFGPARPAAQTAGHRRPPITAGDFLHESTFSSLMVKIPPGISFRSHPDLNHKPRYHRGFCTRVDPEFDFNREIAGDFAPESTDIFSTLTLDQDTDGDSTPM